ncbi:dual specificity protein phosphatase 1B-like isoform X2 [Anneissia japonica]|uniref:dual specificity protein phosphatase 1B-like isoform X2 n=1 Tax=Anneissia japonica TaxID=1529436 RepID=UPI001425889C|nr:dual specificity protein phosphatase 1B-like isoform X2 [Anneissia japonica]
MSEIRPNLFLGARSDAREHKLRENGIKNVLSIEWAKPPLPNNICNKFVYVNDDPDADLLSLMPECVKFIENSIESGGVLVHCFMGISRSSTIVAAYLMKNEKISFDDALTSIRKARPQARPNFGFRQQLDLFQKMCFKVDKENTQYKSHLLRELGVAFKDHKDNRGNESTLPGKLVFIKSCLDNGF